MFDETLELARKVFVYIEEHVLYIEHWMWAAFWAKSRSSPPRSRRWASSTPEDMFFLRRYEVAEAIYDCVAGWSVGRGRAAPITGARSSPAAGIYDALRPGSCRRRWVRRRPRSTSRSR